MIKVLRSDHGGEYLSAAFDKHLIDAGTVHWLTVHDTPQLNGVAECLNQTLMEKVHMLLHTSGMPQNLWGKALHHSTWLKNRTSMQALGGKTPWQAVYGTPPNIMGLKCFSETVWVHNMSGSKLDTHAWEGHWIGFNMESHGHCVYWPAKGTVSVEWNIYFRAGQQLKGEPLAMPTFSTLTEQPPTPTPAPAAPNLPDPPSTPEAPVPAPLVSVPRRVHMPTPPAPPSVCPTRTHIPSRIVRNLQSSMGTSSAHLSNPAIPQGIAILGSFTKEDEVDNLIGGAWAKDDILGLEEDCNNLEQILVTETVDTEALELHSLCHCQATVLYCFQIRFCILTPVQLVPLRTYRLKRLSQSIT